MIEARFNTRQTDLSLAELRLKRRRGTILRWLFTIGSLLVLAALVDFNVMGELFLTLHWGYVALSVALIMADRILVTLRWWILLRARDVRIGFWRLTILHLTAGFFGSFLPTSFSTDVVRIVMLARHTGRGTDCTAASIVDRLLMLAGTLVFAGVAVGLLSTSPLFTGQAWMALPVVIATILMMGLLFVPSLWQPATWMVQRTIGTHAASRLEQFTWAMHAYSQFYSAIAASCLLTVGALLLRVLIVLVLGLSVGVSVGYVQYLLAMPIAWLAAMLPISVGGLGLQEGAYAAALSMIGISMTVAVSISLLDQVVVRFVSLSGAFAWMIRPDLFIPVKQSHTPSSLPLNINISP